MAETSSYAASRTLADLAVAAGAARALQLQNQAALAAAVRPAILHFQELAKQLGAGLAVVMARSEVTRQVARTLVEVVQSDSFRNLLRQHQAARMAPVKARMYGLGLVQPRYGARPYVAATPALPQEPVPVAPEMPAPPDACLPGSAPPAPPGFTLATAATLIVICGGVVYVPLALVLSALALGDPETYFEPWVYMVLLPVLAAAVAYLQGRGDHD